jgi:hypothetical protein
MNPKDRCALCLYCDEDAMIKICTANVCSMRFHPECWEEYTAQAPARDTSPFCSWHLLRKDLLKVWPETRDSDAEQPCIEPTEASILEMAGKLQRLARDNTDVKEYIRSMRRKGIEPDQGLAAGVQCCSKAMRKAKDGYTRAVGAHGATRPKTTARVLMAREVAFTALVYQDALRSLVELREAQYHDQLAHERL